MKHYINNTTVSPTPPPLPGAEKQSVPDSDKILGGSGGVASSGVPSLKRKKLPQRQSSTCCARCVHYSLLRYVGQVSTPLIRFSHLGGIDGIIGDLKDLLERPMLYPQIYRHLGIEAPRLVSKVYELC